MSIFFPTRSNVNNEFIQNLNSFANDTSNTNIAMTHMLNNPKFAEGVENVLKNMIMNNIIAPSMYIMAQSDELSPMIAHTIKHVFQNNDPIFNTDVYGKDIKQYIDECVDNRVSQNSKPLVETKVQEVLGSIDITDKFGNILSANEERIKQLEERVQNLEKRAEDSDIRYLTTTLGCLLLCGVVVSIKI